MGSGCMQGLEFTLPGTLTAHSSRGSTCYNEGVMAARL